MGYNVTSEAVGANFDTGGETGYDLTNIYLT
jgi:hypothetical protein